MRISSSVFEYIKQQFLIIIYVYSNFNDDKIICTKIFIKNILIKNFKKGPGIKMENMYLRKCSGMLHKVKAGETMYHLSRMYNVSIDELISANPDVNVYNMQIGDEVCIPVSSARTEYADDSIMAIPYNNRNMENVNRNDNRNMKEDFYELVKRFDK